VPSCEKSQFLTATLSFADFADFAAGALSRVHLSARSQALQVVVLYIREYIQHFIHPEFGQQDVRARVRARVLQNLQNLQNPKSETGSKVYRSFRLQQNSQQNLQKRSPMRVAA
jgi:hypothetical protein